MKIYNVTDPEFKPYGQIVTGLDEACANIVAALEKTEQPKDGVGYVPTEPILQELPETQIIADHCFGGIKTEMGWCNGFNRKLNCLEYHRNSEFNLGTQDFILLVAKQDEITNFKLDTSCVKAFKVPAGMLVEVYATTLHYAPCHVDPEKGFRVLIALPWATNTERPDMPTLCEEDKYLTANNKWLLAHADSSEAKGGALIGLVGPNIDLDA